MLLLELDHTPFEEWFINLFRQGLLTYPIFSEGELRREYLKLCWKDEELWQKWKLGSCNCFSYPKVLSANCPVHQIEVFERSDNAQS
jgi:hypothetical protein